MQTERWLVTGASGQLGSHLVRQLARAGEAVLAVARGGDCGTPGVATRAIDLADLDQLRSAVLEFRPTRVIHAGAMSAVADCLADPTRAERCNVEATHVLAEAAHAVGARLLFTSTDMVFDGQRPPYREEDPTSPLSVYGRSKARAEQVLRAFPHTVVVRIPLMYGFALNGRRTTFASQIAALEAGASLRLFDDEWRTCVWLGDAARALIGLARSDYTGWIHISGPERLSRLDLIARCAALLGIAHPNLVPVSRLAAPAPEPRPADLSLDGRRFSARFPELVPGPLRAECLVRDGLR